MTNRGFKGTHLGVSEITIAGSTAQVKVQFVDRATSQTHATMHHTVLLSGEGADPAIVQSVRSFLTAVQQHITRLHFTEPEVGTPIEEVARGISESLRGEVDEPT